MKRTVEVTFLVDVEVDETKFTPQWMASFRDSFYGYRTVEEHIAHLATLEARDALSWTFIEGYGPPKSMGIRAKVESVDAEVLDAPAPEKGGDRG